MSHTDQLKTGIEKTRQDLTHTVDELVHRVNPKEQARSVAHTTRDAAQRHGWQLAIAGGVVAGLVIAGWVVKRRRGS